MTPNAHSIVPVHLAIRAMRDNGYKNAAYALAELMDNSIQAGAGHVELLVAEERVQHATQQRFQTREIAVLDDGSGMDARVLRLALQFGNGTHLSPESQDGIGRFGMGLPSSSISQCTRVDVWSWQDGPDTAIHTYLDLGEVERGERTEVPEPAPKDIPPMWRAAGKHFGLTGTLVVWSGLDRLMWKQAWSLFKNSELLIGRMYRSFLASRDLQIRLCSFVCDFPATPSDERYARPNDPGYLMARTSCPAPFDAQPMFDLWGTNTVSKVDFRGEQHEVRVTFSVAKEEARRTSETGIPAGSLPHGKHAAKNMGVSLMRAGRELDLDLSWCVQSEPRERWWGVEVEFPPALDDLFGVSNNKQSARNFYKLEDADVYEAGDASPEASAQLDEAADPRKVLHDLSRTISTRLQALRRQIAQQAKSLERSSGPRHDVQGAVSPEAVATSAARQRTEDGHASRSDAAEAQPAPQRIDEIERTLLTEGIPKLDAHEIAARTVETGLKFTFVETRFESSAFFAVEPRGGVVLVKLNPDHPAYTHLIEVLQDDASSLSPDALRARLANARDGLKLLLMAWARYEDEKDGPARTRLQDTRAHWGLIARQFMRGDED